MSQIIENLVRNAARFARTNVAVTVSESADRVVLSVRDDGPGFPPEFLSVAFERFSVADPARTRTSSSGTGIGLAIVRSVAERANGSVSAHNNTNMPGATVTVMLPRVN